MENGRGNISTALLGTLLMAEMEELSRQSGEMERFKYRAGEEELDAVALVLDLVKAFERVSLPVVWPHFSFPRKMLRVLCGYFEHQRRVQFEGCVVELLLTITAILPRSKWSCLLLRFVLQDALSEVTHIYLPTSEVECLCG